MKKFTFCFLTFSLVATILTAQTSPPSSPPINVSSGNDMQLASMSDTINFTAFASGTIITNQYVYDGAFFSGYSGSTDPVTYDYGSSTYGKIMHSDNWYNPLRLNFVNPLSPAYYQTVQHIEYDNPVSSEIDYISANVYDSLNNLIYHSLSASPQHVVINLPLPNAAYMTFDDSANTAFVLDNIRFDIPLNVNASVVNDNLQLFPNPFHNEISLTIQKETQTPVTFVITNICGQTVYSEQENSLSGTYNKTIDLSFLSNGVYFLDMNIDGKRTVKKIVKE